MQAPARVRTPSLPPYLTRDRVKLATLEMAGTTALLLLYFLIRGIRPDDVSSSLDRGLQIVHLERQLGVFTEIHWQQAFLQYNWLIDIANQIYAWGHYVSLLPIGIWLALKDPPRFRFVRNVLLLSAVIGIVVYWTLPTAPPRLIDGLGFVDTVHGAASDGVVYFQPGPFVNHYAALPSFHFGWMLLSAMAIWVNTNSRALRALAATMPIVMWWAVTVTGNHFFFDMVFGAAVIGACWLTVWALDRSGVSARIQGAIRERLPRRRRETASAA